MAIREDYIFGAKRLEKDGEKVSLNRLFLATGKNCQHNHYRARVTLLNKKSIFQAPIEHQ